MKEFDDRVERRVGVSDVEEASVIDIGDERTHHIALSTRRYRLDKLAEWIKNRFAFEHIDSAVVELADHSPTSGILLLWRR